jgi:hypothetical protein
LLIPFLESGKLTDLALMVFIGFFIGPLAAFLLGGILGEIRKRLIPDAQNLKRYLAAKEQYKTDRATYEAQQRQIQVTLEAAQREERER